MRYLHQALRARRGHVVRINFDKPAKIMLLSDIEFEKYKAGKTFTYRGGYTEESPLAIKVPNDGKWHVVIELGYFNKLEIEASVEIEKPADQA